MNFIQFRTLCVSPGPRKKNDEKKICFSPIEREFFHCKFFDKCATRPRLVFISLFENYQRNVMEIYYKYFDFEVTAASRDIHEIMNENPRFQHRITSFCT